MRRAPYGDLDSAVGEGSFSPPPQRLTGAVDPHFENERASRSERRRRPRPLDGEFGVDAALCGAA